VHTVESRTGSKIACWSVGAGPPILLVHGTTCDRTNWALIEDALAGQFTVITMNRVGREGSSPQPSSYQLEDEFEDVVAVLDWIGEPVHLVGHSAGGLCALGASRRSTGVRSLTLYEPPPGGGEDDLAGLFRDLLASEPPDAVVRFFMQGAGESDDELDRLAETPAWPAMVGLAPTIPAELEALRGYRFEAADFARLQTPVLLMSGGAGNPLFRVVLDGLAEVLPSVTRAELEAQRHMAPLLAPEQFGSALTQFVEQL
jgi:pimeloyl-ACP methyl ester carboxylesterase